MSTLELTFTKKAPALPKNVKEVVVKIAPWLEILSVIFSLQGLMAIFGLNTLMYGTPYGGYVAARAGYSFSIASLFLIANFILMVLAIPGLFKRSRAGWNFVYYSVILNAIYSLVTMQLFSLIVGIVIGFYILFQVKSYYK